MGNESWHRQLPIAVDKANRVPIQHQLTEQFKNSILTLKLMPGQLLPSSRELAAMFDISRATAVRAYRDLTAQGYIETIEGLGTFVRKRLAPVPARTDHGQNPPMPLSEFANHIMQLKPEKLTAHDYPELNYGCSPPDCLPLMKWKQALLKSARDTKFDDIEYGDEPFGYRPLRTAISNYLFSSRMIDIPVDNLVVCASSTYLLSLMADLLIDPGDLIAFPEPGAIYARDTFSRLGADIIPVTVDKDGLVIDDLFALARAPKLVYLNSSHHDPTGACLSMERRKALVSWAEQKSVVIVEDDYDADYRYAAHPLPPLRALSSKVIYISSFWRTLYPLVNVSFVALPSDLVAVVTQAWQLTQNAFHTHFPFIDQAALTDFLHDGEYERLVQRSRSIFADRWRACVHELTSTFGMEVVIAPESSNYHVFIQLHKGTAEQELLSAAREAGLPMLPAGRHYMAQAPANVFLVPFAHLDKSAMADAFKAFRAGRQR